MGLFGLLSFVTSTFMLEVMAAGNAWLRLESPVKNASHSDNSIHALSSSETTDEDMPPSQPLLGGGIPYGVHRDLFELTDRIEMGKLASFFFNRVGIVLYYLCIVIYLYGDLAIYAAAMPKALVTVACEDSTSNCTSSSNTSSCSGSTSNLSQTGSCFGRNTVTKDQAYYIFLAVFTLALGPFVFFNVQKTKYLQIVTSITRYVALGMMVVIALKGIVQHGHHASPSTFNVFHLPNLFGNLVYAFMCQHSLPSLITPIRKKKGLTLLLGLDFLTVCSFYALIVFTAITRFQLSEIKDEYTNNFSPAIASVFPSYFIRLFPVFTLSTNFPIIGVTLRNNLKALFHREGHEFPFIIDRIVFPLAAILPPVAVAFATQNLVLLVGITGSYAGVGVQYVVPTMLVWCGRNKLLARIGHYNNHHQSIFRGKVWILVVCVWAVASWIMVTVNNILSRV